MARIEGKRKTKLRRMREPLSCSTGGLGCLKYFLLAGIQ